MVKGLSPGEDTGECARTHSRKGPVGLLSMALRRACAAVRAAGEKASLGEAATSARVVVASHGGARTKIQSRQVQSRQIKLAPSQLKSMARGALCMVVGCVCVAVYAHGSGGEKTDVKSKAKKKPSQVKSWEALSAQVSSSEVK